MRGELNTSFIIYIPHVKKITSKIKEMIKIVSLSAKRSLLTDLASGAECNGVTAFSVKFYYKP